MQEAITWKNFFYNKKVAIGFWFGLALLGVILELIHKPTLNNFNIFLGVFKHTIAETNLYAEYPAEYHDLNHYGPLFSIVIAPFYYLPYKLSAILWVLFNAALLYAAIRMLPIQEKLQNAVLVFASHELLIASEWTQTNPFVAACLIFSFCFIYKEKEIWALFFILLATFVKLYGIVGCVFFLFSKNKLKFIFWGVIWSAVFFVLPMLISSPKFILQTYQDWYADLVYKANRNVRMDIKNDYQDISIMGIVRRVFKWQDFKNTFITLPAMFLFTFQTFINYKNWNNVKYQLMQLCIVLIMTVNFTTSAESPTYIIAFPAVCIWFLLQPTSRLVNVFFVFALLLTSFGYSDIFTPYVRENITRPYSLKALPCFLVWCVLIYQTITKYYLKIDNTKLKLRN